MKARQQNTFRIVAGAHRGRRLEFPPEPGLRPSPDRVRETLFNWLAPRIAGARCLDLFAGSGALGLEALSRGAGRVEFVDTAPRVVAAIREHLGALREGARARVHVAEASAFLRTPPAEPFDIVFLDPPYAGGLLAPAAAALEANGWLAPEARIYLECGARDGLPPLPGNWRVARDKRAGQVGYFLAVRNHREPPANMTSPSNPTDLP